MCLGLRVFLNVLPQLYHIKINKYEKQKLYIALKPLVCLEIKLVKNCSSIWNKQLYKIAHTFRG